MTREEIIKRREITKIASDIARDAYARNIWTSSKAMAFKETISKMNIKYATEIIVSYQKSI